MGISLSFQLLGVKQVLPSPVVSCRDRRRWEPFAKLRFFQPLAIPAVGSKPTVQCSKGIWVLLLHCTVGLEPTAGIASGWKNRILG
jgi:hypothetical protein